MGYITPVMNWTSSDFFNTEDFSRIYNNARLTNALAEIMLDEVIAFTTVVEPTATYNPAGILALINALTANIENIRVAMSALLPSLGEIKDDWLAGRENPAPNYTHVNQWESTIDVIWDHWNGDALPVCPILSSDLTIPTATDYIVVDCIQPGNFSILPQGTGVLYII